MQNVSLQKSVDKSADTLELKMKILCGLSHVNDTVLLAKTMNSPEPFFSPGKLECQFEGSAGFKSFSVTKFKGYGLRFIRFC